MTRIAVFPGSFDPVTLGHIDIIERAVPLFDKIIIAIGKNSQKQGYFTLEQRLNWLQELYVHEQKISVDFYEGLTINYCVAKNAGYIIRGLRSAADYEYEKVIAQTNKTLNHDIETVFILSNPEFSHVSSTIVKEVLRNGGDITKMVPLIVTRGA
ncbi:MAG: pantetheine-phosphate adenylyltransferase [Chitinophagales bacterium]|jgi:pantetheine-phosphate adenylyltransferase|nr:pantetheine-phosphate adenylyltransferase [Bacteroidota bacterium]MBK9506940.1 pantetheine-phosphate adenylyltransferase [Bacteroidota bacterium]MBK9554575.1 pantetheine-phosphate adenylyltransferase [Bacteroidota bacterium]MBP8249325.1 pantetheine-phosphate adenylyltransferase [Chitinophagales bacterium]MBP9880044.1 pantetheine-phosphate adenylyltransferase [Chitinophagales bacterium]